MGERGEGGCCRTSDRTGGATQTHLYQPRRVFPPQGHHPQPVGEKLIKHDRAVGVKGHNVDCKRGRFRNQHPAQRVGDGGVRFGELKLDLRRGGLQDVHVRVAPGKGRHLRGMGGGGSGSGEKVLEGQERRTAGPIQRGGARGGQGTHGSGPATGRRRCRGQRRRGTRVEYTTSAQHGSWRLCVQRTNQCARAGRARRGLRRHKSR